MRHEENQILTTMWKTSALGHRFLQRSNSLRPLASNNVIMSGTQRSAIVPGTPVSIVLKCDQRSGQLTNGIVQSVLTNSANHPRGIKVRLTSGQVGRVQHIQSRNTTTTASQHEVVGGDNLGHHAHYDDYEPVDHTDERRAPPRSGTLLGDWFPPSRNTTAVRMPETLQVVPWTCAACTFENIHMELECEMCMTARRSTAD